MGEDKTIEEIGKMTTFLVCGAGMMAQALVYDLRKFANPNKIIVLDIDRSRLDSFTGDKIETHQGDLTDRKFVEPFFKEADVACAAASYKLNAILTDFAIANGTHFIDMGGNNTIVEQQFAMSDRAAKADLTVIPDCGLAPGMASIVAADGIARFDSVDSVKLRVGGLPQHPQPPLDYSIFFSPEGLLNEYREPTVVLRDGKLTKLESLTEVEELSLPPNFPKLEAFHTSGGASTLPYTYEGKIRNLDYKTIRYLGHVEKIKFLFDLGMADETPYQIQNVTISPDRMLREVLSRRLPKNAPDVILLYGEVAGTKQGKPGKVTYTIEDYLDVSTGHSAMQRTTAYSAGIVMQMIAESTITQRGTLRSELGINTTRYIELLRKRGIALKINIY
jgi:lysine 6-dehydrogenase